MNKNELIEALKDLAEGDLEEGSELCDHPCSVAVRAIEQCFDDINILCRVVRGDTIGHSKKVKMLVGLSYNPNW